MAEITYDKQTIAADNIKIVIDETNVLEDTEIITSVKDNQDTEITDRVNVEDSWDADNSKRYITIKNKTPDRIEGKLEVLVDTFDLTKVDFELEPEIVASTTTGQADGTGSTGSGDTSSDSSGSSSNGVDTQQQETSSPSVSPTSPSVGQQDVVTSQGSQDTGVQSTPTTTPTTQPSADGTQGQTSQDASSGVGQDSVTQQPVESQPQQDAQVQQEVILQTLEIKPEVENIVGKENVLETTDGKHKITSFLLGSNGGVNVSITSNIVEDYEVTCENNNIEIYKLKNLNKFKIVGNAYTTANVVVKVNGYKPLELEVEFKRQFTIPLFSVTGDIEEDNPNISRLFETRLLSELREENLPFVFPFSNAIDQDTQAPLVPQITSSNPIVVGEVIDNKISIAVSQRLDESVNSLVTISLGNHIPFNLNVSVLRADWMPSDYVPTEFAFHGGIMTYYVGDKSYVYIPEDVDKNNLVIEIDSAYRDTLPDDIDAQLTYEFDKNLNRLYIGCNYLGEIGLVFKHDKYLDSTLLIKTLERVQSDEEEIKTTGEVYFDLGECPKVKLDYNADNLVSVTIESSSIKDEKAKLAFILEHSRNKGGNYDKIYQLANGLCTYNANMSSKDIDKEDGANNNAILYSLFMSVLNEEDNYTFTELFRLLVRVFKIYKDEALNELKITRFEEAWQLPKSQFDLIGMLGSFFNKYVETNGAVSVSSLKISDDAKNRMKGYIAKQILP